MDPGETSTSREEAIRGASRTLGRLLDADPAARATVEDMAPLPSRAELAELLERAWERGGMAAVRREKRRRLLAVAARDLHGELELETVGRALADLADACLRVALLEAGAPEDIAVLGLGKLGAGELNYVSDIDIIFVSQGDPARATKACEVLLSRLGAHSPEGQAYIIDTKLRPEGRDGPLVRSLESCLEYYRRWAKPWELQALIKARTAAGDVATGEALIEMTRALVFPDQVPAERVASIRKIKERVESHASRSRRGSGGDSDVKLGPGGIRDIEFSVQLLQLVHGGSDPVVRKAATLDALVALGHGGYIADEDGAALSVAYRWLRAVEHRLQLWQERRVHHLPRSEEARAGLARAMGFKDSPLASAGARFDDSHRAVLTDVRSRFERLFYRPMIESLAQAGGQRLSPEALNERLRVLGFRDVERAARTLGGLVAGTTRRARLFRVLTPAFLRFVSESPLPDEGLFAFLRLGEALGDRLAALAGMRDNPPGLRLLAAVLGSGRVLGELLEHVPEEVHAMAGLEVPDPTTDSGSLVERAVASLGWREPEQRLDGLRRFKRKHVMRIAVADIAGRADLRGVGAGLAALADACLAVVLQDCELPFAVIGMGKLGGRELNYASDIDVMFVHGGDPAVAERIAEDLLKAIGQITVEGQVFEIDANLRPEGRSGPLARSLDAYLEYYEKWAKPWEHQALIKARFSAGDRALGEKLVSATRAAAFPERLEDAALGHIRHLKARMERERIPRGVDPRRHIKLGPGGLADVEFSVQILQLRHARAFTDLRTANTLEALDAARAEGLLSEEHARRLSDAYDLLTRLRNRLFFMTGRAVDELPGKPERLEALGIALGYRDQPRQELEEAFLRATRRARRVAEAVIYG